MTLTDMKKLEQSDQLRTGNVVVLFIKDQPQLGYIQEVDDFRRSSDGYAHFKLITQLNDKSVTAVAETVLKIRNIDNIAHELQPFEALQALKYSPLLNKILDPINTQQHIELLPSDKRYLGIDRLNQEQYDALINISAQIMKTQSSISLIHGPPGTGKSLLITNLVIHLAKSRHRGRILVVAPSNAAVDVLALKLIALREKMPDEEKLRLIRCGQMNNMHPKAMAIHPDNLAYGAQRKKVIKVLKDMNPGTALMLERQKLIDKSMAMQKNPNKNKEEIRAIDQQVEEIENQIYNCRYPLSDLKVERRNDAKNFIKNANVVCVTLGSLSGNALIAQLGKFETCIVDEATLATECLTIVPSRVNVSHMVLVGDTKQLPALVRNKKAKQLQLDRSLFARIELCKVPSYKLIKQYRMHPAIYEFPNNQFYRGEICNSVTVQLTMKKTNFPLKPYLIFELDSMQNLTQSATVYNIGETEFIYEMIQAIKIIVNVHEYRVVQNCSIAVVTPYVRQKTELEKKIR